jgi:hypothetical protein
VTGGRRLEGALAREPVEISSIADHPGHRMIHCRILTARQL